MLNSSKTSEKGEFKDKSLWTSKKSVHWRKSVHYTVRRTPLSEQCVSIAKNQYDHLKYLKVSDSYDSKFNCNVDILIGEYYYWDFVSGNIRRENSDSVAVENILGWVLSGT